MQIFDIKNLLLLIAFATINKTCPSDLTYADISFYKTTYNHVLKKMCNISRRSYQNEMVKCYALGLGSIIGLGILAYDVHKVGINYSHFKLFGGVLALGMSAILDLRIAQQKDYLTQVTHYNIIKGYGSFKSNPFLIDKIINKTDFHNLFPVYHEYYFLHTKLANWSLGFFNLGRTLESLRLERIFLLI